MPSGLRVIMLTVRPAGSYIIQNVIKLMRYDFLAFYHISIY